MCVCVCVCVCVYVCVYVYFPVLVHVAVSSMHLWEDILIWMCAYWQLFSLVMYTTGFTDVVSVVNSNEATPSQHA